MIIISTLAVLFAVQANTLPIDTVRNIDEFMSTLHGEFNGSILVAVNDQAIYSKGFGKANFKTGENFTPSTSSCIASLTKQFTAMGIMMLAEKQQLTFDDPVTKHIRKMPPCYQPVTIRHLLNHTSGVFDYDYLGQGSPDKLILKKNSLHFSPGERYEYSNSNYVLLSMIMERLSGVAFPDFLHANIFGPLGMTRTFVYQHPSQKVKGVAVGYNQFVKVNDYDSPARFGDGGVYSSVEDLFKWHSALYTEKLVKRSTFNMAFTPGEVQTGTSTYGFGWNISLDMKGKYAWHTGNTAGFRAYIQHRLDEPIAIIILTNTGNSRRIEIASAINSILHGLPYPPFKKSAARKMYTIITQEGVAQALQFYDSAAAKMADGDYDFSETEFNLLGYELLGEDNVAEAVEIFELNTKMYPHSSNTFDSLGEAYLKRGDKKAARSAYQKALEIDPGNLNAAKMIQRLN